MSQCPHLQNSDNNKCHIEALGGFGALLYGKHSDQCLAWIKYMCNFQYLWCKLLNVELTNSNTFS